jgi:FKBP-type peptidyl-prolyl cis-trans isomerase 2
MKKGDFLRIEYVGRVASTGEIFDLTDGELARKEGIHNPGHKYGPVLVIVGSGMAVPGVEKQLLGMKPGEKREFDVSRDEGFGRREPRLIKVLSYQRFISQKINPVPGIFVNIDGRHARIQSVSGGRVRVDFNSPLAGKDLHYRVRLVRRLTAVRERAQALLEHYGLKAEVSFSEGTLTVKTGDKLPDQLKELLNRQLTRWIKEIKKISYGTPKKPGKAGTVAADKIPVGERIPGKP